LVRGPLSPLSRPEERDSGVERFAGAVKDHAGGDASTSEGGFRASVSGRQKRRDLGKSAYYPPEEMGEVLKQGICVKLERNY
jgi:hypothetical protein